MFWTSSIRLKYKLWDVASKKPIAEVTFAYDKDSKEDGMLGVVRCMWILHWSTQASNGWPLLTTKYKSFITMRILSFSRSTIVWRPSSMDATCPLHDGWCFASHRWQLHLWSSDFLCCLTDESWIVEHPLPPYVCKPIPPSLNSSHASHFITPTINPLGGFDQYNHRHLIFHLLLNLHKKTLGGFCNIVTSLKSGVLFSLSTASSIFESQSSLLISLDSSKQKFKYWRASWGGRLGPLWTGRHDQLYFTAKISHQHMTHLLIIQIP